MRMLESVAIDCLSNQSGDKKALRNIEAGGVDMSGNDYSRSWGKKSAS